MATCVVTNMIRNGPPTIIMPDSFAWVRSANNSVCPGYRQPAMLMASLLIGAVTIPSRQPNWASSTAFSMKVTDAAPVSAAARPGANRPNGVLSGSSTATVPGRGTAASWPSTGSTVSLSRRALMVRAMMGSAPITSGRQILCSRPPDRALAITSGPIPAGSPIVIPSNGSNGAAAAFRVGRALAGIEVHGIADIEERTSRQ